MGASGAGRSFVRSAVWIVTAAALCIALCVGWAARVSAPQVWVLLTAAGLGAGVLIRLLLLKLLSPLLELRMLVTHARESGTGVQVEPKRYGAFAPMAELSLLSSPRPSAAPSGRPVNEGEEHGTFLRSVSHEMRTPLNAILGFADVLVGELDGPITRDQRENLTIIRESAQKLSLLVTDMIDVASLTSGDSMRVRTSIDMGEALEVVREAALERRGMRPVHVRVDVSSAAERVVTERDALIRALRIVVEHVLEATQSGEVALYCERDGADCVLSVSGDGVEDVVDELGALLDDIPQDGKKAKASRLRLAIAKELFALLGARVQVLAQSERGAAIAVRIPMGDAR